METTKIKEIIRNYYKDRYVYKLKNLEKKKKDRFLGIYNLPKLSHDDIETLNRPIMKMEIE